MLRFVCVCVTDVCVCERERECVTVCVTKFERVVVVYNAYVYVDV